MAEPSFSALRTALTEALQQTVAGAMASPTLRSAEAAYNVALDDLGRAWLLASYEVKRQTEAAERRAREAQETAERRAREAQEKAHRDARIVVTAEVKRLADLEKAEEYLRAHGAKKGK